MARLSWLLLTAAVLALTIWGIPAVAQEPSIQLYNRDTYEEMPVKSLTSRTLIVGPIARTHMAYTIGNKYKQRIEVAFNLNVPEDTILVGFSYYYQNRLIKGKMYDNEEAWKIYRAVTSRGRDPGVMDRNSATSYHAQIFPVEPGNDLKVEIETIQVIGSSRSGLTFELPVALQNGAQKTMNLNARVQWIGADVSRITDNFAGTATREQQNGVAVLRIAGEVKPERNWRITLTRPKPGLLTMVYSGMTSSGRGYYAMLISPPRRMVLPRLRLVNRLGTSLSMPTAFATIPAYGRVFVVGRYKLPGTTRVVLTDRSGRSYSFTAELSSQRLPQNAAGPLWADKRIAQLENSARRDWRPEIIRISKAFNVISSYTALLAIPAEELAYYRKLLAENKVESNTSWTRGGSDPWIRVKAPEDALQVVAVFPSGEAKNLTYDEKTQCWSGRFDIPFGTPEGEYRVTVIVVHPDGTRTHFVLVYENRLNPLISATATSLRARHGDEVTVKVTGGGISRAVAVTPWGERMTMVPHGDTWQSRVRVPDSWPAGSSVISVVLMDGAHNRTEISVDLQVTR